MYVTKRRNGWTLARQLEFLRALMRHGVVARAATEVGMTEQSAYRLKRRQPADWQRLWDDIVDYGSRAHAHATHTRKRARTSLTFRT